MSESGAPTRITIDFNQDFYSAEAVAEAVVAFRKHGELAVEERGPYRRVIISGVDMRTAATLRLEIANYVLAAGALASAEPQGTR